MSEPIFKKLLLNSGFDEPVYDTFRDEIALQNSRLVETTSFIGGIMMLVLTLVSVFVKSISRVMPLYFTIAVLFCLIYVIVHFVRPKSSRAVIALNYLFLLTAFAFSLGLDIIQKNPTATTVCVLLVALPLLIVDRPYREFIFFLAVALFFMFESMYIKQSPKASIEVVNAISFLGIGTFLGYKHNQMMLRNIRGQYLLKQQRDTDALTNLYNKSAFETLSRNYIKQPDASAGMIIIDMDNFKHVNDTYGHQTGDEILSKVGTLLSAQFRASDYVCRFGGDEFVAFLPNIASRDILKTKAENILDGVAHLRIEADESYRAHICIGVSVFPEDGKSFDELFKNADDAMYRVKKNGKNGYGFYDASIKKKILLVDDIEMNRAVLKKILSTEYEIIEAADGGAALAVLTDADDITMVITDIQMPGMNGIELIKHIRADARYNDTAIIANTQYGDSQQDEQILTLGADDFVYKATSPAIIQNRVRNVLKAKEM